MIEGQELSDEDVTEITKTYHEWKNKNGIYSDIKGYCKSSTIATVKDNNYTLTPSRYVGFKEIALDETSFKEKMKELRTELSDLLNEEEKLSHSLKSIMREINAK